jgi:hypothetical protein
VRQQERAERLGTETFWGVPIADFERGGREQLMILLMLGLQPHSKVVDYGCGVLRGGYWLIHFLDPGCYHGIEPHTERLQKGLTCILEAETREAKQPRFDSNADFDTSVFGERFDFFLAYSIWTHASKRQVATMLDAYLHDSTDDGVFLVTVVPTNWRRPDYKGEGWFGTSHESDRQGIIFHDMRWIRAECAARGLSLRVLGKDTTHGQTWLAISREPPADVTWFKTPWRRVFDRWRARLRRILE